MKPHYELIYKTAGWENRSIFIIYHPNNLLDPRKIKNIKSIYYKDVKAFEYEQTKHNSITLFYYED